MSLGTKPRDAHKCEQHARKRGTRRLPRTRTVLQAQLTQGRVDVAQPQFRVLRATDRRSIAEHRHMAS